MNLDPDNFEKRLQSRPLRRIPEGWREEILSAVHHASSAESRLKPAASHSLQPRTHWRAKLSRILSGLETTLWPGPRAWASLAAAWLVILAINFANGEREHSVAKRNPLPASEVMLALQEQERVLAELLGTGETPPPAPPRPAAPRPRSQRPNDSFTG
jgi:hypothetical protein